MKSALQIMKIPAEDQAEFIKQHLQDEAKLTVKYMVADQSAAKIFDALRETYGDKVPLGTRLKEFYDRRQTAGETIRSYAYDLQEKLMRIQRRDKKRVPDADLMLKEQLALGLWDDILRREIKKRFKENEGLTFSELMQDAISWSEEEETRTSDGLRSVPRSKGVVDVTVAAEESMSQLTMEILHEEIKKIASRQDELFQMMNSKGRGMPPGRDGMVRGLPPDGVRFICYTCNEPGHTSRRCPRRRVPASPEPPPPMTEEPPVAEGTVQQSPGVSIVLSRLAKQSTDVSSGLNESAFGDCLAVDVKIAGVTTKCLLDTGSEVTTIRECYFKRHFGEGALSSANWVQLTAANGLEIPLLGCLEAEVECMGKNVGKKCVFVLKDNSPDVEDMKGLPGILRMNVLNELPDLFVATDGVKKLNKYRGPEAKVHRVLANIRKEAGVLRRGDRIGYVKIAGRETVTIPPLSERILEGRLGVPTKTSHQVLLEAASGVSLPKSLLVANVLAKTTSGRVPVRVLNSSQKPVRLKPRSRLQQCLSQKRCYQKSLWNLRRETAHYTLKSLNPAQLLLKRQGSYQSQFMSN